MNFQSILKDFPSGTDKDMLVSYVGSDRERFRDLLDLALLNTDPVSWRAAWILDASDEQNGGLAAGDIQRVIRRLPEISSTGTLRCLLRMLCRYSIDEDDQGLLIDLCFRYLVSELYPVAVKVHAMQIIYEHVLLYPELKDELLSILEDQMDNNTVGFRSRARRLIKAMEKM